MKTLRILSLACVSLLGGCFRVGEELEPKVQASVQDRYLHALPSPFPPVASSEAWAQEERIGRGFAKELDLYQAMTAFRRAAMLLPPNDTTHHLQLHYDTLLAYYLGGRYQEVLYTYESTPLKEVDLSFRPYRDLMVILYDAHQHLGNEEVSDKVLEHLAHYDTDTARRLTLSTYLSQGNVSALEQHAADLPGLRAILDTYTLEKKSTRTAQLLNTLLPGAGYLYVGQKQSALTAAALNGLFIWASVYCFQKGHTAAGIILTSLEAGWYFGGIYGAGQEAKLYNERLYETLATPYMNSQGLFPVLMLHYAF